MNGKYVNEKAPRLFGSSKFCSLGEKQEDEMHISGWVATKKIISITSHAINASKFRPLEDTREIFSSSSLHADYL